MNYNFERYLQYMAKEGLDAIIASNYNVTARMRNHYFKDDAWMSTGLREYNPFVGCDSKGEMLNISGIFLEQGIEKLVTELRKRGLERGVIGLEILDFPAKGLLMLQKSLPLAAFVDASWVIHQDIAHKTEREIGFIRKSVEASEAGFRKVMEHIRDCLGSPISELIWRYYAPEVNRYGAELIGSNVSGIAWEWEEDKTAPVVKEGGEPINFDLLCGYQGLMSDIAFRGMIGSPDADFSKRFEEGASIVNALSKTIKPGMTAAEAEERCLEVIKEEVGSWDEYWSVHNVGFHVHEFPMIGSVYLGRFGDYVFEAGNVLSVEAMVEQAFVLCEDGLHRLGKMPMKIYCA